MKKAAWIVVAAVALLALGLPPVLGRLAKSELAARVAEIDATEAFAASVLSHESGWFSSRAKISIGVEPEYRERFALALPAGASALQPLLEGPVTIAIDFAHGPIALFRGVHFGLSSAVARLDPATENVADTERRLGVPYLFEFRSRTGFAGDVVFRATAPPMSLGSGSATIEFSGATASGTFAHNELAATGQMQHFELKSPSGTFTVDDVSAFMDNEIRSEYLMPGHSGLAIGRIAVVDPTSAGFEYSGMSVRNDVSLDSATNRLELRLSVGADSILVPGSRVANAKLGLTVRDVDAAALHAYLQASEDTKADGDPTTQADVDAATRALLASGPTLALDPLEFRLDDESFSGHAQIAANPSAVPPPGPVDWEDPALLLGLFTSTAELNASKKLAQRLAALATEAQLAGDPTLPRDQVRAIAEAQSGIVLLGLTAQGILRDTGDGYRTELRLADGALTVNGAVLPLAVP
jgi:uncharacterized protein YdgA (DUF945 family)